MQDESEGDELSLSRFESSEDEEEETPRSSSWSSSIADKGTKYDKHFYEDGGSSGGGHRIPLRASTAPARPLTEIEEFRRSSDFLLLESTVILSSKLKIRPDNKYDLDSQEGQKTCKRFLN